MKNSSTFFSVYTFKTLVFFCGLLIGIAADAQEIPAGDVVGNEIRFAAVGDTGRGNAGQNAIARQMLSVQQQSKFDLILFLGDNIYNNGSPADFGRKFTLPYQAFIENGTRLSGVIGNHDERGKGEGGILLQQLMFGIGPKPYFSFLRENASVEFFGLDSNAFLTTNLSPNARAQLQWLDTSLGQSKAAWKIVLLHHPLYSSAKTHGWNSRDKDEMQAVRAAVEPILEKHKVRIVLAGHDHVYERLKPQNGVLYFVSGAGAEVRRGDLQTNSPFYQIGNDKELSFMLFSVKPDAVRYWAINSQGAFIDSGRIE